jgi:large subunit ribosomal protein L21
MPAVGIIVAPHPFPERFEHMYAVIRTGGKQYKVAPGDVIEIERVKGSGSVSFTPLLVVDDEGRSTSGRSALAGATVDAKVLHESRGPKTEVMKFRNKTGYRRHSGHRQTYTSVEISGIKMPPEKS